VLTWQFADALFVSPALISLKRALSLFCCTVSCLILSFLTSSALFCLISLICHILSPLLHFPFHVSFSLALCLDLSCSFFSFCLIHSLLPRSLFFSSSSLSCHILSHLPLLPNSLSPVPFSLARHNFSFSLSCPLLSFMSHSLSLVSSPLPSPILALSLPLLPHPLFHPKSLSSLTTRLYGAVRLKKDMSALHLQALQRLVSCLQHRGGQQRQLVWRPLFCRPIN